MLFLINPINFDCLVNLFRHSIICKSVVRIFWWNVTTRRPHDSRVIAIWKLDILYGILRYHVSWDGAVMSIRVLGCKQQKLMQVILGKNRIYWQAWVGLQKLMKVWRTILGQQASIYNPLSGPKARTTEKIHTLVRIISG